MVLPPLPVVVIVIVAVVANAFVFVFEDHVVIIVYVAFNVVFPLSFSLRRSFFTSLVLASRLPFKSRRTVY